MFNIILASKSAVRKKILNENGIKCLIEPANIDEELIKKSLLNEKATPEILRADIMSAIEMDWFFIIKKEELKQIIRAK